MKTPRLRILQVASGDLWGGAEVQIANLCRRLQLAPEVDLRVALLNPGILASELQGAGIEPAIFDEGKASFYRILADLRGLAADFRPDIIQSHRLKENLLAGLVSAPGKGVRCIATIHGGPEIPFSLGTAHRAGLRRVEMAMLTHRFERRVFVSHELQERLDRRSDGRSQVIENGIDLATVPDRTRARERDREEMRHIAFLGRMVPVKRPDLILAVAERAILRDALPYTFHFIGEGPLLSPTRDAVIAAGLSNRVVLHGFQANPLPLLARMDALLITSDHEGLPTNLLEALALGLPVVAHAVGEIPRVLNARREESLGFLVHGQDPEGYLEAIGKAVLLPELPGVPEARKRRVRDRYTADRNAARYLQLYREIVAGRTDASEVTLSSSC